MFRPFTLHAFKSFDYKRIW